MNATLPLFGQIPWSFRGKPGTSSARFSDDRRYRYELRRTWDASLRPLLVIACNPSTSDEGSRTDPTTKRLLSFASAWGLGGLLLLNCYALCSTDPKALRASVKRGESPIGPDNDATLRRLLESHKDDRLLLAWGGNAKLLDRGQAVARMALEIHGRPECFGLTSDGHPSHPLYLPDASVPHLYADLVRRRAEAA